MDLRLREVTWVRLLSLLLWTILMILNRGITQLLERLEGKVFKSGAQPVIVREREEEGEERTLLPPLSDELVLERIWPLLHRKVNISLLWRLRRVNHAWRKKVAGSLEWGALEIVRIDAPGLTRYLEERQERRPPLRERVEDELRAITVLISEDLAELSSQGEYRNEAGAWSSAVDKGDFDRSFQEFGCPCCEEVFHYSGSESEQSEGTERNGSWSSSSERSLRVFYPRHSVRV